MEASMVELKSTPGPWEILGEDRGADDVPYIEISSGECGTPSFKSIAFVQSQFDGANDDWKITDADLANAHLLAAAPDLYEALVIARGEIARVHQLRSARPQIDAALSRARGEGGE
jgi:hypothetical protein